jgi:hypothetical protein
MQRKWEEAERTVYGTEGANHRNPLSTFYPGIGDDSAPNNSGASLSLIYAFKNLRFIHAQLSANPPSVIARPTSNDQDDRRKADAADRLVRYGIRQYKMQERIDQVSLDTLLYGSGFMKTIWDSNRGDIIDIDESGELTLEGELSFVNPSPWNMFIDPDPSSWDEVRYVFERRYIPYEEALFQWPEYRELIDRTRIQGGSGSSTPSSTANDSTLDDSKYDVVEIYEYWETGLPTNGYLGRFCYCLSDGTVLGQVGANPFRFSTGKAKTLQGISKMPERARLPYHIFTDIDIAHRVWGASFVDYITGPQDILSRLDSSILDAVQAHGIPRIILPEGAEISDDSITNSPWDVIRITGVQPPHFMEPMPLPPAVNQLRDQIRLGIDDMSGVNEAMFGQQSREQSGFSMQYATNQGNMIRRRLFNKYVLFVEAVYKSYLSLIQKHWTTTHTIQVLGREKALESVDIRGADIDGGFDIVVEYGASLSLDPMTRREEILSLQPLFEKAGVPTRVSLKMMKLNELEGLYDMMQLAEDRQREIFEEMISTGSYIPPEQLQDHENMMAYALQYVMTVEYKYLEDSLKPLIIQHINDRAAIAAQERSGMGQGQPGMMPGGPGVPGPDGMAGPMPPVAGNTGEQAAIAELPPIPNG